MGPTLFLIDGAILMVTFVWPKDIHNNCNSSCGKHGPLISHYITRWSKVLEQTAFFLSCWKGKVWNKKWRAPRPAKKFFTETSRYRDSSGTSRLATCYWSLYGLATSKLTSVRKDCVGFIYSASWFGIQTMNDNWLHWLMIDAID